MPYRVLGRLNERVCQESVRLAGARRVAQYRPYPRVLEEVGDRKSSPSRARQTVQVEDVSKPEQKVEMYSWL